VFGLFVFLKRFTATGASNVELGSACKEALAIYLYSKPNAIGYWTAHWVTNFIA